MLGGRKNAMVELECSECGAVFKAPAGELEKGKVRCPKGHEVLVMGLLGGSEESEDPPRR